MGTGETGGRRQGHDRRHETGPALGSRRAASIGISATGCSCSAWAGEFAFEPDFLPRSAWDATLGPQVRGKKLVKLAGELKNLVPAPECANGKDPIARWASRLDPAGRRVVGAGSVKIDSVNCIYTGSLAIEQSARVEAVFGNIVNGEVPNPVVAAKVNLSGFVGVDGNQRRGRRLDHDPAVGEGRRAGADVTRGVRRLWPRRLLLRGERRTSGGQTRTEAFRGCDLAPWRATPRARPGPGRTGALASAAGGGPGVRRGPPVCRLCRAGGEGARRGCACAAPRASASHLRRARR